MRILAVFKRVVLEMLRDRRTLVLMMFGPLLMLSLIWAIFQTNATQTTVLATQNVDATLVKAVDGTKHLKVVKVKKNEDQTARQLIRKNDYAGVLKEERGRLTLTLANSNPSQSKLIRQGLSLAKIKLALQNQTRVIKQQQAMLQTLLAQLPAADKMSAGSQSTAEKKVAVKYLYGSADSTYFDAIFPIMISFVVFFFVFLISGIALLRERTRGTLDRVLATPIRRGELIGGYILGYGMFAIVQTLIIVGFSIWIFKMQVLGSLSGVFLTNSLVALVALTLGLLISSFAQSEFQMMQFVPIVVIPQILFSGLIPFDTMPHWLRLIGYCAPLYYGSTAMTSLIEKGAGLLQVGSELGILVGFAFLFIILNVLSLRKYRPV
ncbi:ABC transporter permease [Limosilactobacillus allomucosae]|uniref:ABC transporter permease n=1 Tax=Limosilactobacillus allomucosae TaxID=3142938 RepID=A0AAU7C4J4_9LACO